jgi:4-hydroxy-tetrahydrodipicolinate reductase
VGTTGWDDVRDEVRTIVDEAGIGYLWGANFSIGANIFFSLAAAVARAIDPFDEYDISVHETHHDRKADSPSGTALHVAERILEGLKRKTRVLTEAAHRKIEPDELHVSSTRLGSVPGTHVVTADSPADTIEVIHRARSRRGFALGAVRGAEWVVTRRGLFDVSDFMDSVMHEGEK